MLRLLLLQFIVCSWMTSDIATAYESSPLPYTTAPYVPFTVAPTPAPPTMQSTTTVNSSTNTTLSPSEGSANTSSATILSNASDDRTFWWIDADDLTQSVLIITSACVVIIGVFVMIVTFFWRKARQDRQNESIAQMTEIDKKRAELMSARSKEAAIVYDQGSIDATKAIQESELKLQDV
eukprot:PhF_6_TR4314/c0_g1_i1/m.5818